MIISDPVEAAKKMNSERGYVNYKSLIDEYDVSEQDLNRAGGVKRISARLGLNYRCYKRYDPSDIKNDFLRVYQKLGAINIESYLKHGNYSKQAIKTAFGSVNNLMKELSIPLNSSRFESPEVVMEDIKRVYNETGSSSSQVYRSVGKYSQSVVERCFGSWGAAVDMAGIRRVPNSRRYGREYVAKELRRVYDEYGFINSRLVNDNCEFSYQAASRIFGGVGGIERALGIESVFKDRRSAGEKVTKSILEEIYGAGNVLTEQKFDWLRNPETGHVMYVDFVIKDKMLCFEYDGAQHFYFSRFFYKKAEDFEAAVRRDKYKQKQLEQHGFRVVHLSYKDGLTVDNVRKIINESI